MLQLDPIASAMSALHGVTAEPVMKVPRAAGSWQVHAKVADVRMPLLHE
jgi:hypothetical protein